MKSDVTQMPLGQRGVPITQDTASFVVSLGTQRAEPLFLCLPRAKPGAPSGGEGGAQVEPYWRFRSDAQVQDPRKAGPVSSQITLQVVRTVGAKTSQDQN